jgi:aminomethyltransferase
MLDRPSPPIAALAPPSRSVILRPGMRALPAGVERYTVQGGRTIVVDLDAGDRITVSDVEGGQPCELIAFGVDGRADLGVIGGAGKGMVSDAPSPATRQALAAIADRLKRRNIDLSGESAIRVFSQMSRAGERQDFRAERKGYLVASAPGGPMDPVVQDTATPIDLRIERANPKSAKDTIVLPDPLADPLQDIRVNRATAESYFVRAGEYIQIIDVAGRQCSDFQCFSARKLDKGRHLPLDATTTRSLTGMGYPTPGLPAKAFDQDMEPLAEIVQDTVGRHDAFALACYAKFYEDLGYPGHANCTDNFNRVLDPYGIEARKGWMALNFFYNTRIDANNIITFDEPWSRPGDYVLLRAVTDLVCVSSACPDDIDASNAWNPSDIHVRTYSDKERFVRAVAHRMTPDAEPKMTRETAFHPKFAEHTRDFTEYRGYWLPQKFNNGGAIDEYWACRERAAVMDLSPLRKFEVTGPDAEALMQYALTRDVRKLAVGQVVYSAMCYEHGGMLDDGTLFRLGPGNFRWIGGDEYGGAWLRELAAKMGFSAWVRSSTDQLHNVAVQGPKSRDILKEVIWTPPAQPKLEELNWFRFLVGRLGAFDGAPVVVSRTGYTGELGYEVFCHPKDAGTVFDAVWAAGEPHGLAPLGLQALDMLRIEAGLIFFNYEFSDQTDPFEAGIGFTVPLKSKSDDFVGRDALIRRQANPQKKLVGLEIDSNEAIGHGDCVHVGRAQIGLVTSATRSPVLKQNIALARLDVAAAEIGTEVEVGKLDGQQKRLPARVVRFPHYDPEKVRVRS